MDDGQAMLPCEQYGEGLRLAVRVTPRAACDAITGMVREADGRTALAVRLAAPPVEGVANMALIRFLAKELDVPRSAIALRSGGRARLKILHIRGDPEALIARIAALCGR